jgi:excinuclease ABC subunit C
MAYMAKDTAGVRCPQSEYGKTITAKIPSVPAKPGIYIFRNAKEKVLYVGKAKNLKSRIAGYFRKSQGPDIRKTSMICGVRDFDYIVTDNELEAFVLEANLIKQYKPKFNIILKDDKNYPYLKLTVSEEWPRLEVVRRISRDGALYFGPYVPAGSMWEALDFIRRNFQVRDCRYAFDKRIRPCIRHQMGRCLAPCAGLVNREEYAKLIDDIRLFLGGKKKDLINGLRMQMDHLSQQMRFEDAARIRDRIRAIEGAWASQKVIAPELADIDVIGFHTEALEGAFKIFFIRNGSMIGSKDFFLRNPSYLPDGELLYTFIVQFYAKDIIPPSEIAVQTFPADAKSLERWLSGRRGGPVAISVSGSGKKKELVAMAAENAAFIQRSRKEVRTEELMQEVGKRFRLMKKPASACAFDVSNISGEEAVGAFVYWSGGEFRKDMYRRLRIKTVAGIDDYSMMEETIGRIVRNFEGNLPDIAVIDGGRGHLEAARKAFEKNKTLLVKVPDLIAVAKDPDRAYLETDDNPVDLEDGNPSSLFLKRMRDEVHRFAVSYHRKLRGEKLLRSPLEGIAGIGKKRRLALLKVFGSIENVANAKVDEIAGLKGFSRNFAEHLLKELRRVQ